MSAAQEIVGVLDIKLHEIATELSDLLSVCQDAILLWDRHECINYDQFEAGAIREKTARLLDRLTPQSAPTQPASKTPPPES